MHPLDCQKSGTPCLNTHKQTQIYTQDLPCKGHNQTYACFKHFEKDYTLSLSTNEWNCNFLDVHCQNRKREREMERKDIHTEQLGGFTDKPRGLLFWNNKASDTLPPMSVFLQKKKERTHPHILSPQSANVMSLMQLWFCEVHNRQINKHTHTHTQGWVMGLSLFSVYCGPSTLHRCSQLDACHQQQPCLLEESEGCRGSAAIEETEDETRGAEPKSSAVQADYSLTSDLSRVRGEMGLSVRCYSAWWLPWRRVSSQPPPLTVPCSPLSSIGSHVVFQLLFTPLINCLSHMSL